METPIGINWSHKVLDFYHFGESLDLFRGGNLLLLTTVVFKDNLTSIFQ